MKAKRSVTLAAAGIVLVLALTLTAGASAPAGTRPNHAPPPSEGGAVLGDYHWSPLGGPVAPGGQVYGLDVHPTLPDSLYAAASAPLGDSAGPSTIFQSTDGAASWAPLYQAGNTVLCLAAAGSNVYAGAFEQWAGDGASIYASNDGGATWYESFSFDTRSLFVDVSVDPADPGRAIMGGMHARQNPEDGVLYGTTDGGATWNKLLRWFDPAQNSLFMAVLISPHDPGLVLATMRGDGPGTHVFRSTDGGASWAEAATIPDVNAGSLVAHATDPNVIYAGTGCVPEAWWGPCQVYRSGDAGLTWDLVLPDAGGVVRFEPPSTVYALAGQLWASASNGDPGTWSQVGGLWDGAARFDLDLGVSPTALYAGLNASGVAKSTDGGANWNDASNGIAALTLPRDIDVDPVNLDKIFVSTEGGRGGYRSDDGGGSWTQVMGGGSLAFEINPIDPSKVYAGVSACDSATLWGSTDGGLTFNVPLYTPPWFQPDCSAGGEDLYAVEHSPTDPATIYAAGEVWPSWQDRQAVVVSTHDYGATWNQALPAPEGSGFDTLAVSTWDYNTAWAGGRDWSGGLQAGVIYRTQDGGANWSQVFYDDDNTVRSIVVDPVDPAILYAATDNAYDLYKSEDGGDSWTLIRSNNPPFEQPSGNKLAIDPNDHNHIYLGGWGYIAESFDAGATWTEWNAPVNQGTPEAEPRALAVDTGSPVQTLYAGFWGLWAHTRPVAASGDRYVATTGDDYLNACTDPQAPCLTVGWAVGQANPGETIRVAQGTYVENLYVDKGVTIEGGYSGPPSWTRDLGLYETVLDGSAGATIPGDWDGDYLFAPTVLYNGSEYEMWYSAQDMFGAQRQGRAAGGPISWAKSPENPLLDATETFVRLEGPLYRMWLSHPDGQCITYAWSNDGLTWTEEPDPALCAPHDGSWESDGVWDPSVVVDGGGTYWMFYEAANWSDPQPAKIGCATSPDGLAWTRCAGNPVLVPDTGTWDENWAVDPAVLLDGTTFKMWYRGQNNAGTKAIGYATSPDGVSWTKHAGNPVLEGTPGAWDENQVHNHTVWFDGTGYHLWYTAQGRIGYAASPDGIAWTKHPDPVLEPGWWGQLGLPVVRFEGTVAGARLDGFSVTGGNGHAGGVQVYGPDVTIAACKIHHNIAALNTGGGGVAVENPGSSAAIVGCQIYENDAADGGGVMFWNGASGQIAGTTITENTTRGGPGAGIEVQGGGSVTVENSLVQGNHSAGSEGGINVQDGCSLSMTAVEVRNNTAQGSSGGIGASAASITLVDVTVNDNQSLDGEGGGLVLWNGTVASMTGGGVAGNRAEHGAGGINVGEWSTLTLDTVVINGNTARWSTGLRLHRATVTGDRVWIQGNVSTEQNYAGFQLGDQSSLALTNALIAGNDGGAGAVWGGDAGGSTLSLTNVTVADNGRSDGWGGVYVSGDSSAQVRNSILVWNGNADLWCDDPGTCLVEHSDLFRPWPGAGNISTNPRFVDRAAGDYHLAGGSPCIEAADPAFMPPGDIDGEARPYDGDGDMNPLPDMGADEYTGPPMPIEPLVDLYVDGSVGPEGTGTPTDPYTTVGEAVAAAFHGDTIHVADGTYVENLDLHMDLNILGGYSGVPDWVRDPGTYITVLDGSANPSIPGDWDGGNVRYSMVIEDGGSYKMWYTGCGNAGPCRIGLATSPDGIAWTKHPGNPVLETGEGGTWDGDGLESPYVVKDGPTSYKMWYTGYNGCAIGLATSPDGISWTKHGGNPVLAPGADPWNNVCVQHPTVLYEGGLYKMWLAAQGDDGGGVQPYLAYATSPDGITWTWDPANPLFARDWEEWFWRPYVLPAPGGYEMWYSVWAGSGVISYAASPDGLAWTKHGSPVLAGTPGEWDDGFVSDPTLLFEGGQYRLWYDNTWAVGGAESPDGLTWAKRPENPLLLPGYYGQDGAPAVYIYTPSKEALDGLPDWLARRIAQPAPDQAHVLLDGLSITGGTYSSGAGVQIDNADVTLQGVHVFGNQAFQNGGGIAAYGGSTVQILGSQILENIAQGWGGGASVGGGSHVTMQGVLVLHNQSVSPGAEGGGLVFHNDGTEGHLVDVQVVENQADGGGGISLTDGPNVLLTLERVEIVRNVARWAAGIRPYTCTVLGNRVWIVDNVATEEGCGGFNAGDSNLSLTNSLITGNAGNAGCAYGGTLALTNVTVADNTHSSGNGGLGVSGDGIATVHNSILFYNGTADLSCDPGTTCTVEYSDLQHPWPGPGNILAYPRFVDRPGGDYHLKSDSLCIDAASLGYAPDHDVDGDPRPFDGDGDGSALPDMGADEYVAYMFAQIVRIIPLPNQILLGAVRIVDESLAPVPGALVETEWTLPSGRVIPRSGTTNANGVAITTMLGQWSGEYTNCVVDVTVAGYLYNPDMNLETCATYTKP